MRPVKICHEKWESIRESNVAYFDRLSRSGSMVGCHSMSLQKQCDEAVSIKDTRERDLLHHQGVLLTRQCTGEAVVAGV